MGRDNGGLWWKTSKVGRSMRAHDCNGDKTADSSGECDFIESIVALQYRHHLDIIYCTFREKWVLEVFFFFNGTTALASEQNLNILGSYVYFVPWTICWNNPVSFASHGFPPPLPSLINKMTHKRMKGVSFAL